jgi:DNA polymerase III alpha subunit (gram-positive type)
MTEPWEALLALGVVAIPGIGETPAEASPPVTRLLIADLEMSGPNPLVHEVLDVGWVITEAADGFPEVASWSSRVKPRRIGNAEIGALKVVGYTPKAWRDAIDAEVAIARMVEQGAGAAFTGWGFAQDLAFITAALRNAGVQWPFAPVAFDVQVIARSLLARGETVDRFNLGHVADRLGIGRMGEHGALADAYATFDILIELGKLKAADLPRPA